MDNDHRMTAAASDSRNIPENVVSEIQFLTRIARANGALLTLKEIGTLTQTDFTEERFQAVWSSVPGLAGRYELKDGYLVERNIGSRTGSLDILENEMQRRSRAARYVVLAREFAKLVKGRETALTFAISGSASYESASLSDDLDFFCITRSGFLWLFLVRAMILSRFFRISHAESPRICFSYAVDERYANREFACSHNPLFARDALTTKVVHGTEFYANLLKRNAWISNYFPQLFRQRTSFAKGRDQLRPLPSAPLHKFLNYLLYFLVGNYVATKSKMLNRKFRKLGRLASIFTLRIGPDHCIFESVRYSHLRIMYADLSIKKAISCPAAEISFSRE